MKAYFTGVFCALLVTAAVAHADQTPSVPEATIQIPELSQDEIRKFREELLKLAPPENLKYEDLFSKEDQKAFDEVQANLFVIYKGLAGSVADIKETYVRGVIAVKRFLDRQAAAPEIATVQTAGSVADMYKNKMSDTLRGALGGMLNGFRGQYAYRKGADGKIDSVVEITTSGLKCYDGCSSYSYYGTYESKVRVVSAVFGRSDISECSMRGLDSDGRVRDKAAYEASCPGLSFFSSDSSLLSSAEKCVSEVCALEIQKISTELLQTVVQLDKKVTINGAKKMNLFYNPQHSMLRKALREYMDDNLVNKDVSTIRYGLIGLTNIGYIGAVAPVDFLMNLRTVNVSMDFSPGFWKANKGYRGEGKASKVLEARQKRFGDIARARLDAIINR